MKISVIGLGQLGLPLAGVLAQYYDVNGVDLKPVKVEDNEDRELQKMDLGRLVTSTDFSTIKGSDIVFNIVPTPSLEDGTFSNEYLFDAINQAKPYLDDSKLLVVTSTVMPGTCEKLDKELECDVCYNPEFIRLGHVVEDMRNPDFVLIGEGNKRGGDLLEKVYEDITEAPIKRMDLRSAELAKIALNSYITMKISFANIIGEIAERDGLDAKAITDAIGEDRRIGKEYFEPTGAYGGPCFPRDNIAFSRVAGGIPNYSKLTDQINKHQAHLRGFHSKQTRYRNI